MSRGVDQSHAAPPARKDAGRQPTRLRQSGFTLIELLAVITILGILAALIAPRYADLIDQSRQQAARSALAEGYSRLKLATARYVADNHGGQPAALTDLSPNYMNATSDIGDYTVVLVQGSRQVTLEIYPGAATTGTPLASHTTDWPN